MLPSAPERQSTSQQSSQQGEIAAKLFEERLGRLFQVTGVSQDNDLANVLGVTPSAIHKAKKRKQLPLGWIVTISEKYGLLVDWLIWGSGPMRRGQFQLEESQLPFNCLSAEQYEMLPLLESKVVAGPDGAIMYEDVADQYPFKKWWIEKLIGRSEERKKDMVLVKVRGDSMSPTINQGEIVMLDTYEGERIQIKTGKIYMVRKPDGSISLKRLALSREGDRVKLVCFSDNVTDYEPFEFDIEPGRSIQYYVLGRVRWAGKEFD